QAELVKAVTPQNLRVYLRPCLFCECRPFFWVEIEILVLIRTLLPPFYEESLHFVSEEVAAVLCLQPAKQRLRDPSPAVVGAKLMILHNQQSAIRNLDHHFARGHQNPEVGHGCLRRKPEPLRQSLLILGFNGVELSFFRAAAGSGQAVANPIELDPSQRLFYDRLLAGVQGLRRDVNRSHADARIESFEQGVRELLFPAKFQGLLRQLTIAINFERENWRRAAIHNVWHV